MPTDSVNSTTQARVTLPDVQQPAKEDAEKSVADQAPLVLPLEKLFGDPNNLPEPPAWYKPNEDGEYPCEPPIDFIETYAQYADVLEAPREMHEAVAEMLVATVLNSNGVTVPHGALTYPLDLWTLLLSGSGGGRSTLIGLTRPILQEAELTGIERDAHWGSRQAIYQQVADNPTALWTWGEISERLKLLNQPQFAGAKEWITDRYDNFKAPAPITYRQTGKNKDTPPIQFAQAPRINILATSSESWFFANLLEEDSTGGFLPRWVPVRARGSKDVPTPRETDPALARQLATLLRQISNLKGQSDLSEILDNYDDWYREAKRRFESQPNQALAMAYFNRHRVHILKLAVIYEASSPVSLKVSKASWDRAVQKAEQIETSIFALLETGMSTVGYTQSQMVQRVKNAGVEGLSRSDFTRAFQQIPRQQREDFLATLVQGETIVGFNRNTQGRTANILVHKDFVAEYKTAHPNEQAITKWGKP